MSFAWPIGMVAGSVLFAIGAGRRSRGLQRAGIAVSIAATAVAVAALALLLADA